MKKFIILFLLVLLSLSYSNVSIYANTITSYYNTSNSVKSYSKAFKLVQKKNKDHSKSSYYKPIKHHHNKFTLSYFKYGNKKRSIVYTITNFNHNKKIAVTNDDSLYQLPSNLHGTITNGK